MCEWPFDNDQHAQSVGQQGSSNLNLDPNDVDGEICGPNDCSFNLHLNPNWERSRTLYEDFLGNFERTGGEFHDFEESMGQQSSSQPEDPGDIRQNAKGDMRHNAKRKSKQKPADSKKTKPGVASDARIHWEETEKSMLGCWQILACGLPHDSPLRNVNLLKEFPPTQHKNKTLLLYLYCAHVNKSIEISSHPGPIRLGIRSIKVLKVEEFVMGLFNLFPVSQENPILVKVNCLEENFGIDLKRYTMVIQKVSKLKLVRPEIHGNLCWDKALRGQCDLIMMSQNEVE